MTSPREHITDALFEARLIEMNSRRNDCILDEENTNNQAICIIKNLEDALKGIAE